MGTIQEDAREISTLAGAGTIMHRLSNLLSSVGDEFDRRYRLLVDAENLRKKRQQEILAGWRRDAVECERIKTEHPGTPNAQKAKTDLLVHEKHIAKLSKAMEI